MSGITELSVADAVAKLGQSKQDLWKEKVTDVVWYSKIVGIISYLLNVNAVDQYNIKLAEVVNQVSQVILTDVKGLPNVTRNAGKNVQINNVNGMYEQHIAVEQALTNFYTAFKNRCSKLNVTPDSKEFGVYSQAAKKMLLNAKLPDAGKSAILPMQMKLYMKSFDNVIYTDMVKAFASLAAKDIKMVNFAEKSETMSKLFKISPQEIEKSLREAVLNVEGNPKALADLVTDFEKTDENSLRVTFRTTRETALKADKAADEAKILELNGADRNGTIHTAWSKYNDLNNEYIKLVELFRTAGYGVLDLNAADTVLDELDKKAPGYIDAIKAIKAKIVEMRAANAEFIAFEDTRNKLDQKNRMTNLELDPIALDEAMNNYAKWNIAFYTELQKPVTDVNAADLYKDMDTALRNAGVRV